MNNGVFIPIEIIRREYISKLLLSVELLKQGMPVIIGHKSPVIKLALNSKEPGILFYKAMMFGQKEKLFKKLKEKNFGIVAQDEEAGIIFDNFEDFYNIRLSLKFADKLNLFFTWGLDDFNFFKTKFNKKIFQNVGALRSCFWGDFGRKFYKSNTENLKKKFGNYFLVVSNFSTYNTYISKKKTIKIHTKYRGFDLDRYHLRYENEKKIFFQYIKLIKFISKNSNKKIILRPHPSENVKVWKKALKGIKNVFVETDGELLSWILASELIIQNNCTSSIEAAASNIPVITYADEIEDFTRLSEGDENIPNKLSLHILGEKKMFQILKNVNLLWNEDIKKITRDTILNRKLKDYGTTKAAKNIAEKIIECSGLPNPKGNNSLGKDSFLYDIYELYRRFKYSMIKSSGIMDLNKREAISRSKIQKDIDHLLNIMNIDKKVKLKRVEHNTFYIYPFDNRNEK